MNRFNQPPPSRAAFSLAGMAIASCPPYTLQTDEGEKILSGEEVQTLVVREFIKAMPMELIVETFSTIGKLRKVMSVEPAVDTVLMTARFAGATLPDWLDDALKHVLTHLDEVAKKAAEQN